MLKRFVLVVPLLVGDRRIISNEEKHTPARENGCRVLLQTIDPFFASYHNNKGSFFVPSIQYRLYLVERLGTNESVDI